MWRAIIAIIELINHKIQYKSRIEEKIDSMIQKQRNLERRQVRTEIFWATFHGDRAVVHELYDTYKKEFDGNSYVDEFYKEYCKNLNKRKRK